MPFGMRNQMKKEPVEEVETDIWTCINESCNTWMRQKFAMFEEEPICPLCESKMLEQTRILPQM